MDKIAIKISPRAATGKGAARSIRREGGCPAVLYGMGGSRAVTINRKEFIKILNSGAGSSTLLSVVMEGEAGEKLAIIRDFQTDPIRDELLHADLLEVAMDKVIHLTVPISLENEECEGVKMGGILQHLTRELEIECLPGDMPESIHLDVAALQIGESLHVSDIVLPKGVKSHVEAEKVVVIIAAPITAEKLEEALSAEGAEEVTEPEVVSRGKEEEEEGK